MRSFAFPLVAIGASLFLAGCGSSTTATSADSGTDGSSTNGADGSALDGASDASVVDSGPHCQANGATQAACRACCASNYAAGSNLFDKFTIECACRGDLCGPPEGGAPDAAVDDAGDAGEAGPSDAGPSDASTASDGAIYGNAVCAATCNGTAAPDSTCNTCIYATIGSVSSLGPCGSFILGQCLGDPACNPYLGCVENCP